jgi:hypothetical protein
LARHERSILQRMNHANEVVMPHVGHSRPVTRKNAHDLSPSWVCVPKPRGSGSNRFAKPKTPPNPAAATTSRQRVGIPNRCRTAERRNKDGPPLEWTITPDCKGSRKEKKDYSKIAIATRPKT